MKTDHQGNLKSFMFALDFYNKFSQKKEDLIEVLEWTGSVKKISDTKSVKSLDAEIILEAFDVITTINEKHKQENKRIQQKRNKIIDEIMFGGS